DHLYLDPRACGIKSADHPVAAADQFVLGEERPFEAVHQRVEEVVNIAAIVRRVEHEARRDRTVVGGVRARHLPPDLRSRAADRGPVLHLCGLTLAAALEEQILGREAVPGHHQRVALGRPLLLGRLGRAPLPLLPPALLEDLVDLGAHLLAHLAAPRPKLGIPELRQDRGPTADHGAHTITTRTWRTSQTNPTTRAIAPIAARVRTTGKNQRGNSPIGASVW